MKVLLGVDGSESSQRALEEGLERAREADDRLTVAVFEGEEGPGREEVLDQVRDRLADLDLNVEVTRLDGDPGSQLVELAESDYDRIVIGGGTRSPLGKIRLGTVAEFVLLNSTTSVTLVR
ncbi:universal stress protein [Halobacteriales archaeon Cl-PHB]